VEAELGYLANPDSGNALLLLANERVVSVVQPQCRS
jgi:hypothetical protein